MSSYFEKKVPFSPDTLSFNYRQNAGRNQQANSGPTYVVNSKREVLGCPKGFAWCHLKTISQNFTREWSGVVSKIKTGINPWSY